MAEETTPRTEGEAAEKKFHGEEDLESLRRWGDHEPGFPAGTGPLGKPEDMERKHSPGDRQDKGTEEAG